MEMDKYPIGMSMEGVWMNNRTVNDQPYQYYEETANYSLQYSKVGIKLKICKICDRSYKLRPSRGNRSLDLLRNRSVITNIIHLMVDGRLVAKNFGKSPHIFTRPGIIHFTISTKFTAHEVVG
jgi:hypothetical protein